MTGKSSRSGAAPRTESVAAFFSKTRTVCAALCASESRISACLLSDAERPSNSSIAASKENPSTMASGDGRSSPRICMKARAISRFAASRTCARCARKLS
eukprot:Amastigsp_a677406_39.p2 type:complete len:100 gc:universal Amastigsp_a677406_39:145-444(+)